MKAEEFLERITRVLRTSPPQEVEGAQWTAEMARVLRNVGEGAGLKVCSKDGQSAGWGEYRLDFTYWPDKLEPIEGRSEPGIYFPPLVVIEHENGLTFREKVDDFFKVCLYASPLRVFIGYSRAKLGTHSPGDEADRLVRFYDVHDWRQASEGETLLLLRDWPDRAKDLAWQVRVLRGGEWRASKLWAVRGC
jgi:hypothetical protein